MIRYAFVWFNIDFLNLIAVFAKLVKNYIIHYTSRLNLALTLRLTPAQLKLVFTVFKFFFKILVRFSENRQEFSIFLDKKE